MTKKELHITVLGSVLAYLEDNEVSKEIVEDIKDILDAHLAPKNGGKTVDLSTVVRKDDEGHITEIQCSLSGVWLPADINHFYEDKSTKPAIVGFGGVGLKRLSRQAEAAAKKFKVTQKASITAITDDILALDMTAENASKAEALKSTLEKEKNKKPDFSSVKPIVYKETEGE